MLSCLLFAACGERQTETFVPDDPAAFYSYYPLELGKFTEYRVDSVVYDPSVGDISLRDSSVTYVREVLADTLRDNTGALLYTIERYERADSTDWSLKAIWTCAINDVGAIRTENNLRFLKFIFPLDRRSAWDGNLYIDTNQEIEIAGDRIRPFQNWFYEVDSIDVKASVGGFTFDSTLLITEVDETNAIERRLSRVRYARGVGLVWREQWILDSQYCNDTPSPVDCNTKPWQDKAEKGYILRQTLIDHN
ncbi:MAG: hypothetical protein IT270_09285 [Saprospiraceae bacterium]|nr:hypothetical protein [Saprospiraceae bacterium]